jgi:hypothetical protein
MKLTVNEMRLEDTWRDIARIPQDHRKDPRGKRIRRATICKVTVNNKHKLLAIHGALPTAGCPEGDAIMLLDSPTRNDLGVRVGVSYEVELRPVGWLGYWSWAWKASDPAYRVPAQISLISLALGVIGLLLGLLTLWPPR